MTLCTCVRYWWCAVLLLVSKLPMSRCIYPLAAFSNSSTRNSRFVSPPSPPPSPLDSVTCWMPAQTSGLLAMCSNITCSVLQTPVYVLLDCLHPSLHQVAGQDLACHAHVYGHVPCPSHLIVSPAQLATEAVRQLLRQAGDVRDANLPFCCRVLAPDVASSQIAAAAELLRGKAHRYVNHVDNSPHSEVARRRPAGALRS